MVSLSTSRTTGNTPAEHVADHNAVHQVANDLATGNWTGGLSGAQTDHTLSDVERDRVSLLRFIPLALHAAIRDRTTTTDLTTYVQAAINSGEQLWVPRGRYPVSGVKLIGETDIQAAHSATFIPSAGSAAMFYTENVAYDATKHSNIVVTGLQVLNPNNLSGVTAFDLPEARHGCMFQRITVDGGRPDAGMIGFRLRRLNWNTKLLALETTSCGVGFQFEMAAACLDVLQCVAKNGDIGFYFDGTDITDPVTGIAFGLLTTPITLISIRQGVCQMNNIGVKLRNTYTTRLEKMHFENNGTDIDADSDRYMLAEDCEFAGNNNIVSSGTGGLAARSVAATLPVLTKGVKLRNMLAAEIRNPTFYGTRQLGFWDVPTGNTGTRATRLICSTTGTLLNSALGDTAVLAPAWTATTVYATGALVKNSGNLYYATAGGTSSSSGPTGTGSAITDGTVTWGYVVAVPTVDRKLGDVTGLMYEYTQGLFQSLGGTSIDLDQPVLGYVKTVSGVTTITLSNKTHDGRSVRLVLRMGSGITDGSTVRVDGKLVGTWNVVDALSNALVTIENNNTLAAGPIITIGLTHKPGTTD